MKKIKNFLKQKESEFKFKTGGLGPGQKLSDERSATRQTSSQSVMPDQIPAQRRTGPDSNVAEAALARLQGGGRQAASSQKSTLHDLMEDEKRKLQKEAQLKDESELRKQKTLMDESAAAEAERTNPLKQFDESQLFQCSSLLPEGESYPIKELTMKMKAKIYDTFADDPVMRSAMVMFNCNRSLPLGHNDRFQPGIDILKKITCNLQSASNEEDVKKFSRIRKSKIEKTVLSLDGALDFLFSIGFSLDRDDPDWICYAEQLDQAPDKMGRFIELLNSPQVFPIELDRQVQVINDQGQQQANEEDDVKMTSADVKRLAQNMQRAREINDMFVSRATKSKLISGVGLNGQQYKPQFTVLRFKLSIAQEVQTIQATFFSSEQFTAVRKWFGENFGEFFEQDKNVHFQIGPEQIGAGNDEKKSLADLKLTPAATLHVLAK